MRDEEIDDFASVGSGSSTKSVTGIGSIE